jgi:predicted RNase H-like HicB family nuclease
MTVKKRDREDIKMESSQLVFNGVVVREEDGYSALCIDLDVASEGQTIDDAKKNLFEAVTLYIESALESNLPIIRPVPAEENPLTARREDTVDIFNIKVKLQVHAHA